MHASMTRLVLLVGVMLTLVGCRGTGGGWRMPWSRDKLQYSSASEGAPMNYPGPAPGGGDTNYSGAPASPFGQPDYDEYPETPTSYSPPDTSTAVAQDRYPTAPGFSGNSAAAGAQRAGGAGAQAGHYDPVYPGGDGSGQYTSGTYPQDRSFQGRPADVASGGGGSYGESVRTADTRGGSDPRYGAGSLYDPASRFDPQHAPTTSGTIDNPTDQYRADSQPSGAADRYPANSQQPAAADHYSPANPGQPAAADRYPPASSADGTYPSGTGERHDAPTIGSEYRPGDTGYNPPGVEPYRGVGGAGANPTGPHYRPGGTGDYRPSSTGYTTLGSRTASRANVYAETVKEPYVPPSTGDRYGEYRSSSPSVTPPDVNVALPPR